MYASFCCKLSYAKFAPDFAGKVCTHNEIAAFLAKCCDLANAKYVADFAAKLTKRDILIVAMYRLPEFIHLVIRDSFSHVSGDFKNIHSFNLIFGFVEMWLRKLKSTYRLKLEPNGHMFFRKKSTSTMLKTHCPVLFRSVRTKNSGCSRPCRAVL